ncbi:Unknown protein [Striga hermonthica]|uniref:PUM-HD domain-containing protein n=1 Tax=Striga hermonthica TaxID=68872 RepID=A0A9N7MWI3_STRHE|nr:Unknown protein [Striga hermonthica]
MESPTSKTPNSGQNLTGDSDPHEDTMVRSFQNLGFGDENGVGDMKSHIINNPIRKLTWRERWLLSSTMDDEEYIWSSLVSLLSAGGDGDCCSSEPSVSYPQNVSYTDRYFLNEDFDKGGPALNWERIRDFLKGPYSLQQDRLIGSLISGFIVELMTDTKMHPVFQAFLDACKMKHFDKLLRMNWLDREPFLEVVFCKQGVVSMIKLIRKLKKTYHAFSITGILSTRFVEIMTDYTAREVIQTCFILFSHEPNEILYESAIENCHYLAMHKVGCISLNECISTIPGEQRSRLLVSIADMADILCDDPYGNYVLHNVLKLNHKEVHRRIFMCLRGQFVQMARKKVGSHIVEKCMEISENWLLSIVEEILRSNEAPQELAEDQFGNYVIQKALRMTKERGLISLYNSLVHTLKPHFAELSRTHGGKKVLAVIKEGSRSRTKGGKKVLAVIKEGSID